MTFAKNVIEDCADAAKELQNAYAHLDEIENDPDAEQPDYQYARDRVKWAAQALADIAEGIAADMED